MAREPTDVTAGVVSLRVTHLRGVNALSALLGGAAEELYATITIGRRFLGRTPIFSTLDGDVDLPDLYSDVIIPSSREPIPLVIEFFRLPRKVPPTLDSLGHPIIRDTTPVTTPLRAFSYQLSFPWASETHTLGKMPGITIQVATDLVPSPDASIVAPRAIGGSPVRATVALREAITARFVRTVGVHYPTGEYVQGRRNSVPASDEYIGKNDLGRIFISHDRAGVRVREGQSIAVTVALDVVSPFPPPGDVLVRFRLIGVDDPSDDRPEVASRFRGYLDSKDHNPLDEGPYGTPLGPHGHDNEGRATRDPPWEAVPGYALLEASSIAALTIALPVDETRLTFETEIVLHCPSLPGDAFILEVEADVDGFETFVQRTGVLTMWQRIDLQPYVLATVVPVPLAQLVQRLEAVCFQVDVADSIAVDHDDTILYSENGTELIDFFDSFDAHTGEPGWFSVTFYRNVLRPDKRAGRYGTVGESGLLTGPGAEPPPFVATLGRGAVPETPNPDDDPGPLANYVEIDKELPFLPSLQNIRVSIARLKQAGPPDFFQVSAVEVRHGKTLVWIEPVELNPLFVAGQGKVADFEPLSFRVHPSFHRRFNAPFATGPGYELPEGQVLVGITAEEPLDQPEIDHTLLGLTPMRWIGGAEYFGNAIFTISYELDPHSPAELDTRQAVPQHELGHAFGFPHRCGYVSAVAGPCPMGYQGDLVFVDGTFSRLHPCDGGYLEDRTYCPRHQREMRRTVLEDHPAYRWWSK